MKLCFQLLVLVGQILSVGFKLKLTIFFLLLTC